MRGRGGRGRGGRQPGNTEKRTRDPILDLTKYTDKRIRVKFMGGREVVGVLKGHDQLLNLVLDEAEEYLEATEGDTQATRKVGLMVCRGPSVVTLSPFDGSECIANPDQSSQSSTDLTNGTNDPKTEELTPAPQDNEPPKKTKKRKAPSRKSTKYLEIESELARFDPLALDLTQDFDKESSVTMHDIEQFRPQQTSPLTDAKWQELAQRLHRGFVTRQLQAYAQSLDIARVKKSTGKKVLVDLIMRKGWGLRKTKDEMKMTLQRRKMKAEECISLDHHLCRIIQRKNILPQIALRTLTKITTGPDSSPEVVIRGAPGQVQEAAKALSFIQSRIQSTVLSLDKLNHYHPQEWLGSTETDSNAPSLNTLLELVADQCEVNIVTTEQPGTLKIFYLGQRDLVAAKRMLIDALVPEATTQIYLGLASTPKNLFWSPLSTLFSASALIHHLPLHRITSINDSQSPEDPLSVESVQFYPLRSTPTPSDKSGTETTHDLHALRSVLDQWKVHCRKVREQYPSAQAKVYVKYGQVGHCPVGRFHPNDLFQFPNPSSVTLDTLKQQGMVDKAISFNCSNFPGRQAIGNRKLLNHTQYLVTRWTPLPSPASASATTDGRLPHDLQLVLAPKHSQYGQVNLVRMESILAHHATHLLFPEAKFDITLHLELIESIDLQDERAQAVDQLIQPVKVANMPDMSLLPVSIPLGSEVTLPSLTLPDSNEANSTDSTPAQAYFVRSFVSQTTHRYQEDQGVLELRSSKNLINGTSEESLEWTLIDSHASDVSVDVSPLDKLHNLEEVEWLRFVDSTLRLLT
ncbi:U6 snRNP-associated protein Lsm7 [Dispira parvispora]|uniref:U6 snRNP-associated protein Lsm7 n=1 Tax=Dispira parvispora TaxID=1520584 RepID=A0A9W8ATA7_9FUNG|nr:U6 snRNP-associated protein Lsm7 [Dispira parvispora]